jgi:putative transcriptional regulator
MNNEAFEGIMEGLSDAIAFAKGDTSRGRIVVGPDVKAIRSKTKLSQPAFAKKLHISAATLREWEQGRRMPDAPARALLGMVKADPDAAFRLLAKVSA